MNTKIEKDALKWINKNGINLEIDVCDTFRKKGFDVRHSSYFKDTEDNKLREIDIIARNYSISRDGIELSIIFVIECKYIKHSPWILFVSPDSSHDRNILFTWAYISKKGRELLADILRTNKNVFRELPWPIYGTESANCCMQMSNNEKDNAYDALQKVSKASFYLFNEQSGLIEPNIISLEIIFPIIVVDGPLLKCFRDKKNKLQIKKAKNGFLYFSRDFQNRPNPRIQIMTKDYLPKFIKEALNAPQLLRKHIIEHKTYKT
ncbi:MAG: hypothetical protein WC645_01415 [Candidatus Margulisiibacteriota bacterium]